MTSADVEQQVDEIADELYTVRPDEFAAARDEQVRKARAQGNAGLAKELTRLRRPTISAWLINLLWRDQREVLEQLFELADSLARAQAEAAGDELRQLMTVRRQLELTLIRRAHTLADEAGVKVTDTVEREAQETLAAALAQPDVADEVRSGRLVKPASYAGFGTLAVGPRAIPARAQPARTAARPPADVVDLQAAQRARERREAAEKRLQETRAAEDAAAAELHQREQAAEAARHEHERLQSELDNVRERLQRLQQDLSTAEQGARTTAHARDQAQKAHQSAVLAVTRAEQALADLSS